MLLRLGLLPGESTANVLLRHRPLQTYLERALGLKVEFVVGGNYAATGEALRNGQLDAAYLGPVTYVLQRRHAVIEPLVRPSHAGEGPTFRSAIIVATDSAAASLADLRGREIALGDVASTSGAWVPRYLLLEAGLMADRDYTRNMLGAHDRVAQAVAGRQCAAGGLSKTVYERLIAQGQLDATATRVLAVSDAIPEYMWTRRVGLSRDLAADLQAAFLQIRDPLVLGIYSATFFIPAVDSDVDRVRHWMEVTLQAKLQTSPWLWKPNDAMIRWDAEKTTAPDAQADHAA